MTDQTHSTTTNITVDTIQGDVIGRDQVVQGDIIQGHKIQITVDENAIVRASELQSITPPPLFDYVSRPEDLADLKKQVLAGPSAHGHAVSGLQGMGGVGKSILATALCYDEDILNTFSDGIFWITAGREGTTLNEYEDILSKVLCDPTTYHLEVSSGQKSLQDVIASKSVLIILDDVWEVEQVRPFLFAAPGYHTLFTTRDAGIADETLRCPQVRLSVFSPEQAVTMLQSWTKSEDPLLAQVAERLGYLPLALRLAGAYIARDISAKTWLETFESVENIRLSGSADDPSGNLVSCFELSVTNLKHSDGKQLYHSLGVFPEDTWVPLSVVAHLWQQLKGFSQADTVELLHDLRRLALIDWSEERVGMHDLLHDYNRKQLGDTLPGIHCALLQAYNPVNPDGSYQQSWLDLNDAPWSVENSPYLYYNLDYHLIQADQQDVIHGLIRSAPEWLTVRDVQVENMVLDQWQTVYAADQEAALPLLTDWLAMTSSEKRAIKKEKDDLPPYTHRMLAVRCADAVEEYGVLTDALRHDDSRVRTAAVQRLMYLYRRDPGAAFSILQELAEHTMNGVIPDVGVVLTIVQASVALQTLEYQRADTDQRRIRHMGELATNAIKNALLINTPGLNVVAKPLRQVFVNVGLRYVVNVLTRQAGGSSDDATSTVMNVNEAKYYLKKAVDPAAPSRAIMPYLLDRTYGDITQIPATEYVNAWDGSIGYLVAEFALAVHCAVDPDRVIPYMRQVFAAEGPLTRSRQGAMLAASMNAMLLQPRVEPRWLAAMRPMFEDYFRESHEPPYGIFKTDNRDYEYYPMRWYAEIWDRVYPGQPVDLIDALIARAETDEDNALLANILRGFTDPRLSLIDYTGVLGQITPYLLDSTRPDLQSIAIRVAGHFSARQPDKVKGYLDNIELPDKSIERRIRHAASAESPSNINLSFNSFVMAVLAFGPAKSVDWLMACIDDVYNQGDLGGALKVGLGAFLGTLD